MVNAMGTTKVIEPEQWAKVLSEFSERNNGRRARFELFRRDGAVAEEEREGYFESVNEHNGTVTIVRTDRSGKKERSVEDKIPNIRGISVQFDTDGSDNTIEFTNDRGDMTVLHFESNIDGDS